MKNCVYAAGILISGLCYSQETVSRVKASLFDGIMVAGYADHGAFINCTGPNVSFTHKGMKLLAGMLPSLRIKEDRSPGTKNSPVVPSLGAGLTVVYKKIALQIPVYYNTKTSTENGSWKMGVGVGYSFR